MLPRSCNVPFGWNAKKYAYHHGRGKVIRKRFWPVLSEFVYTLRPLSNLFIPKQYRHMFQIPRKINFGKTYFLNRGGNHFPSCYIEIQYLPNRYERAASLQWMDACTYKDLKVPQRAGERHFFGCAACPWPCCHSSLRKVKRCVSMDGW